MGWGNKTVLVTWPRWPPCPYMVKTLKNLLRNQKADDLETWYAALGARVLPSLFKWWPWVDLDLFYGRVKFSPLCFCMGKRQNNGFFRNYCCLWFETSNRWPKWQEVSVDIKTLSPGGCMHPAPGIYACIKSWKKLYKIRLQRDFFETCNIWPKWQDVPVDIKISSPRGCQPLPWGYIHV